MAAFNGTSGDDLFFGGDENDTIVGEGGADSLSGGAGDDLIFSHTQSELKPYPYRVPSLDVQAQADTLAGGDGDDRIYAGFGDVIDGGANSWFSGDGLSISLQGAPSGINADFRPLLSGGTLTIGGGTIANIEYVEVLEGSEFDDLLVPIDGAYINAGAVYGRGGDDHLIASYYVGALYAGEGNDLLDLTQAGYSTKGFGDTGDDTLMGSGALYGGAGNDSLAASDWGSSGMYGGDGNDTLLGSEYGDWVNGDADHDVVLGDDGSDTLSGGSGNDAIFGDSVPLEAKGYGGDDSISGESGDDTMQGDMGDDMIDGGSGVDVAVFSGEFNEYLVSYDSLTNLLLIEDLVLGRDGTDRITGVELVRFADIDLTVTEIAAWFGAPGSDTFPGTSGADRFSGMGGNDTINGLGGDDTLAGGAGNDVLNGGTGTDTLTYELHNTGVTVNLATSMAQATIGAGTDTISNFENLTGGTGSDKLSGDTVANRIEGGQGDDTLQGGAGADTLAGGLGDDVYIVGDSLDTFIEADAQGTDTVHASVSVDTSGASIENITLLGSGSIDAVGNALSNLMTGNDGANVLSGVDGDDTLRGAAGDDAISGGSGVDWLEGQEGSDTIDGGDSGDVLEGGAGGDDLEGGAGNDRLYSNASVQNDSYPYQSPSVDVGVEVDNLFGGAGDDSIFAGYGDNVDGGSQVGYWGDSLSISFQGATEGVYANFPGQKDIGSITVGGGTITGIEHVAYLEGSNYDDFLAGLSNTLSSEIHGRAGDDHVVADYYTNAVYGDEGDDLIDVTGGQYISVVRGGAGNDTIIGSGQSGWNTYHGDEGRDLIVLGGTRIANPVSQSAQAVMVQRPSGYDNTLVGIERIQFGDCNVALDLDGSAGHVARLFGVVLGSWAAEIPSATGLGLSYFDDGATVAQFAQGLIDFWLGEGVSNVTFFNTIYSNLLGVMPSAATAETYVGYLEDGVVTQAQMALMAMTLEINDSNIDFAGLSAHGLDYLPL
ncbi:MAG: calcium-binding protein [Pseudomonadota bacterium]